MLCGILVGILLGPSLGLIESANSELIANWLALPGQLFLILVQMIVVPLVFASIIRGLASTDDINQLKKLGLSVVAFFIITTTILCSLMCSRSVRLATRLQQRYLIYQHCRKH